MDNLYEQLIKTPLDTWYKDKGLDNLGVGIMGQQHPQTVLSNGHNVRHDGTAMDPVYTMDYISA